MSTPRTTALLLCALATLACAGTPRAGPDVGAAPGGGAEGGHGTHGAAADRTARGPAADAQFLQHMIPHHAQALVMTALVPERTTRSDIRLLADRIAVSQRDEIAQMQAALRARGYPAPAADTTPDPARVLHGAHTPDPAHAGMPGMLGPQELARLAAARGPGFDRLFLEFMIRHHQGALQMVSDLLARGGAQESAMYALASEIESDQQMEISRMQRILATMPSPGPAR